MAVPGRVRALFSAVLLCLSVFGAHADDDIRIGLTLPLSGPNAAAGQEGLAAAKAAFARANAAGGIGGRGISLVVMDDEFSAQKAAANAAVLASQGVVALFNCWGTASCSAMMPVVKEQQVPLVAGIAGGGPMRTDPGRWAFNVRPSTADEIHRMVRQMLTVGQDRIAVVYQDDAFGKSGQAAAQGVFSHAQIKPVTEQAIARDGANSAAVVEALRASNSNGVVVVASPQATVALISRARQSGLAVQFYNLAAQANRRLVADLGAHTAGVVFTTLVPSPWNAAVPTVRAYQDALRATTGAEDYSYTGLEVFINAQVLIEGLKRAGPRATREGLVQALESMGERSFSQSMRVKYGPGVHAGSDYVGLTIIGAGGRFRE